MGLFDTELSVKLEFKPQPKCRVCGCSNFDACPGGCWWVEPDLCSRCAGQS